ncbi:MAG: hypothetical protein AB4911_12220 [Oscillochloridaceae bacterium umkhey_bin13]
MWKRKTKIERQLDAAEHATSEAVGQLASTIRDRFEGDASRQVAENLDQLARRIDDLDLSDTMRKRRKELERATKKANRKVDEALKELDKTRTRVSRDANQLAARVGGTIEEGSHQLATISHQAAPAEPRAWIVPTFFGFLAGFGLGFLFARRPKHHDEA